MRTALSAASPPKIASGVLNERTRSAWSEARHLASLSPGAGVDPFCWYAMGFLCGIDRFEGRIGRSGARLDQPVPLSGLPQSSTGTPSTAPVASWHDAFRGWASGQSAKGFRA
jgi:hypothetical protein